VLGLTAQDDQAADTLPGGGGLNWFFTGAQDTITDLLKGEQVN
jgi:hypothetical protein